MFFLLLWQVKGAFLQLGHDVVKYGCGLPCNGQWYRPLSIIMNPLYLVIEMQSTESASIRMQYYVSDRWTCVYCQLNIVWLTSFHHIKGIIQWMSTETS